MAVNINTFKLFSEFLQNKSQQGNAVTISQFNLLANQAQLQLFEKDFNTYVQTGETSEYLAFFLKEKILNVTSYGEAPFPSDYEHTASMRRYYVPTGGQGKQIEIKEVKESDWGNIQISQLYAPTLRFPKYLEFSDKFKFLPANIGIVYLDYFKTPVVPVWGFTTANGRPVYDPTTSTDFEWNTFALNSVMSMYLSMIGINLREGDLIAWSNQYKQETNSVV